MRLRRGFTLIELLITIMIMLVLSTLVLMAMHGAQQSASKANTKATIAKLHMLLSRRWDSYKHRRVPIDTSNRTSPEIREMRLAGLRQLMRMEMPDRWSEVTEDPIGDLKKVNGDVFDPVAALDTRPALTEAYIQYHAGHTPDQQYQGAECLFMILTVGKMSADGGRASFNDSEIGDVDNDGAEEFVDGWGTPIRFLRWPVGFVDDPRQDASGFAHFGHLSDIMPAKAPVNVDSIPDCKVDAESHHDPFDRAGVHESAYRLFPLIYSAGPDRVFDIYSGGDSSVNDNPYEDVDADDSPCDDYDPEDSFTEGTPSVGHPKLMAIPKDLNTRRGTLVITANGKLEHYDNIHNHHIDAN